MADSSSTTQQLFDVWKKQIEEGTQAWARLLTQTPPPPPDLSSFWRPAMDQSVMGWARVFAQTPMSPDVITQWKQFLDQSIEAWSRAFAHIMSTDAFAEMMGRSLDQFLTAQAPVKRAAEQSTEAALQAFNLPSRAQVVGVASQILELEERIERLEDSMSVALQRLNEIARAVSNRDGDRRDAAPKDVR